MKHFFVTLAVFLLALLASVHIVAGNYSVKVGEQKQIYCTATAPAGYITHAFFNLVDPEDARYLGINYTSSECMATIYGLEGKANIAIEVTYAYSYTGTYDHNTHVGHGTYRDYITVQGGVRPTDVKIIEGDTEMYVGQTLELHAKLTPSNAETKFEWGFLDTFGQPYRFDMTYIGGTAKLVAKSAGQVYVVCRTSNDLVALCIVTAKASDEKATDIELVNNEISLSEGETYKLRYKLTPEYASNKIIWTSSNESVATVNTSGLVTAIGSGSAVITASTDNGLKAEAKILVTPKVQSLNLPGSKTISLGFGEKLTPTFYPANAVEKLKWKSSDPDVATVDSDGVVQSKQAGTTVITASTTSGVEASVTVEVVDGISGYNYRNIQTRINVVQKLADKTFNLNR